MDWYAFIDRHDRSETLFCLDPQYWKTQHYCGKELFSRDQYEVMAERLSHIKGRFILSINDAPETRSIFSGLTIESVSLTYTAAGGAGRDAKEVLISNQ